MPPKVKGSGQASNSESKAGTSPAQAPPTTVAERSQQRFYETNLLEQKVKEAGFSALTPAEKKKYTHANLIIPVAQQIVTLSTKTEREFWKHVSKEKLPIRRLHEGYDWGKDRSGRDIGTYSIEDFNKRNLKHAQLTALNLLHQQFVTKRSTLNKRGEALSPELLDEEKKRRKEMTTLKRELYGEIVGPLASDPEWDDVIPVPNDEPADALAKIAYPDDYAEAVSYLRAVMAVEEHSPRCLRLTELVIAMNPAHYTVWLYRFKIISTLHLPVPEELEWLNQVSLENLKNYQIWHHRQLLLDYYYPSISTDDGAMKKLARSETEFISTMLEEDTKNYHVWSYRQYLVKKLKAFNLAELLSTQNLIESDVRNNSAWSHRFFLAFCDPSASTPDLPPTEHDPKVPASIVDREISYSKGKIELAPQNQSPWNYLRGVLAKGGRSICDAKDFAEQFVSKLGEEDEEVRSSHALDLLSEIYQASNEKDKSRLCLQRLALKWDPVREGYWNYRLKQLA